MISTMAELHGSRLNLENLLDDAEPVSLEFDNKQVAHWLLGYSCTDGANRLLDDLVHTLRRLLIAQRLQRTVCLTWIPRHVNGLAGTWRKAAAKFQFSLIWCPYSAANSSLDSLMHQYS